MAIVNPDRHTYLFPQFWGQRWEELLVVIFGDSILQILKSLAEKLVKNFMLESSG